MQSTDLSKIPSNHAASHHLAIAAMRDSFSSFLARAFHQLHPGAVYDHNWHLDVLCYALEQIQNSDRKRIIINVPPRSLKSIMISAAWPAFLLGKNPRLKILCASYSQSLSIKHSLDTRNIMQSDWYRLTFPDTALMPDQNEKHRFSTTQHGMRLATSVGGTVTGEGGDVLILDDPLSAQDAWNRSTREYVNNWFDQVFSTRLNNKRTGIIVLVMQRLHAQDLTEHLIHKGGFSFFKFPAIALEDERWDIASGVYIREKGELLHPERDNENTLAHVRKQLGTSAFAAQYQQQPHSENNGLIKLQWFRRYKELPDGLRFMQSWDTGIKAGQKNDASACITFGVYDNNIYIADVFTCRAEYPELRRSIITLAEKFTPQILLIEDKASGQSLLQDLRKDTLLPVKAVLPKADKLTRMAQISALIEAGKVLLPEYAPWLPAFEDELALFPSAKHDDQADAFSQALHYIRENSNKRMQIRRL